MESPYAMNLDHRRIVKLMVYPREFNQLAALDQPTNCIEHTKNLHLALRKHSKENGNISCKRVQVLTAHSSTPSKAPRYSAVG